VLDRVVQRLLGDAVQALLCLERQVRLFSKRGLDLQAVTCAQGRCMLAQCRDQPFPLQHVGAQLQDQRAHLGQPPFGQGSAD
jgi:hypothetical protein